MSSPVEKIKDRLSIADVVSWYIKLERAGGSMKAKCPFHNEKTPSFFVSPARGTYYCFGCGAKGDIFSFVEQYEGLDFRGALKLLAEKAGVPLVYERPEAKSERDRQYKILEEATAFFEKELVAASEAREYLKKRGLTEKTIAHFRIGFAPDEWSSLHHFLTKKEYADKEIETVGLIKMGESGRSMYDRFRGRIMFPISDTAGRVVGYSGRILKKESSDAKYLNSPETPLFQKSRILFGFDKAKEAIRKRGFAILVEGQMDLIMCHQAGFENAVAVSGTALTAEHVALIKRFADKIMLVFDADSAGYKATLRSAALTLSLGMEVKMAALPSENDPADLLLAAPKQFADALRSATHIIDFLLAHIALRGYDNRALAKAYEREVLPFIKALQSKIEQSHYVALLADKASLKSDAVWEALKTAKSAVSPEELQPIKKEAEPAEWRSLILRRLWGIVFWQETVKEGGFDTKAVRETIAMILGPTSFATAEAVFTPIADELIFEAENYFSTDALAKEVPELVRNLSIDVIQERFGQKMKELGEAERAKDNDKIAALLIECQIISKELETLKRGMTAQK